MKWIDDPAALIETVAALIGEIGSRKKSTDAVNVCLAHARQQHAGEIAALKARLNIPHEETRELLEQCESAAKFREHIAKVNEKATRNANQQICMDLFNAERQVAGLKAQVEGLRKDAERMKHLEKIAYAGVNRHNEVLWCLRGLYEKDGQTFIEALDAAIAQEVGK